MVQVVANSLFNIYLKCFQVVAEKRIEAKDIAEICIHSHLVSVLTTGVLMWSYAILACLTIAHPLPGIVGILASIIHLCSPLLFRTSNNHFFHTNIFIGAGLVHQLTFAYFTGGFDSHVLIWLGILPMLAGVIVGRRGAVLWAWISSLSVLVFFILKLSNYHFPVLISENGRIIAQGLLLFGWIFISATVIWAHVVLVEQNSNILEQSRQRTHNLLNILGHDISTPLTVIHGKLNQLMRTNLDENQLNMTGKAFVATEKLSQIIRNVRELRLNELGKKEVRIEDVIVKDMILELKELISESLDQKNLHFYWSVSSDVDVISSNKGLLQQQILGNLLSNSIKFSQAGGEIRLRVSKVGNEIQFVIADNGLGIPRDMRDFIFEASMSRSVVGTSGEVGSGFGLPIVKGCVDRLGGKICFESKTSAEGPSGTMFKLSFPV